MIRLETSKGTGINNFQEFDISQTQKNWDAEIPKKYPLAVRRTEMSALYNCHGLTFASRRTRVENTRDVHRILNDDSWIEVPEGPDVLAGDLVVYYSEDGDANHSGIVVQCCPPLYVPVVCSKWGSSGEFVHSVRYYPNDMYGPFVKFYRCRL